MCIVQVVLNTLEIPSDAHVQCQEVPCIVSLIAACHFDERFVQSQLTVPWSSSLYEEDTVGEVPWAMVVERVRCGLSL